jgi:hypothetical protein
MDHFSKPGLRTVKISWSGNDLDLAAFKKEFREALHRRINSKGLVERDFREEENLLWRDQQRLNAWIGQPYYRRKTVWGLGFETRYVRDRYPEIEREMRKEQLDSFADYH